MAEELMSEQHAKELMNSLGDALKNATLPPGLSALLLSLGEKVALLVVQELAANVSKVNFGAQNALIQSVLAVVLKLAQQYMAAKPSPTPTPVIQNDANVQVDAA